MKQIKQPKGEVLQFDDDKNTVMMTSAQRQHDLALYKLNLERQMVKRDIRQDQRMVKRKLRDLKRTQKSIKPSDDGILTDLKMQKIAQAVSFLPQIRHKPAQIEQHAPDESSALQGVGNGPVVDSGPTEVTKSSNFLPKIVAPYRPPPEQFKFPMTMRRPSIASTISPLLPVVSTVRLPDKKGYQFRDMDDEDFFKMIKRRTQLPEIKQRQIEEREKSSQMKDKINKFFDPEVEEQPVEEEKVVTPVEDRRRALRAAGRGFGNRPMTQISEKSSDDEEEAEESKPEHKIVETHQEPAFDLKTEILTNPVFAARKSGLEDDTVDIHSESELRKKRLFNLAQKIIPHALERVKVIGESQKRSSQRRRLVRFK